MQGTYVFRLVVVVAAMLTFRYSSAFVILERPSFSVQRACPFSLSMQLESLESLIVMAERLHEIVVKK